MKKLILSALMAGCVTMAANASTGNDHGFFWQLYVAGGSASISFPQAGTYPGNFAVSWSGVSDVVAGKGWQGGGVRNVNYNCGALSGSFNSFGAYGWTTSPLVEFYVTEMGSTVAGSFVGSVSSDGHSYSVYHHQQINQPSIIGNATFWQNLDQWGGAGKGSNHTITLSNHVNFWNSHGMNLGSFNELILAVEAYGGKTGNCNATVW